MKEEPHNGDEHRRGSREPPQKRRREDSESQPPASANRPGFHTYNGPQQALNVPQQALNVPQQAFNAPRQALNVPQQAFNAPRQAFNAPRQAFNAPPQAFNAPPQAFNVPRQIFNVPQQVVPQNQAMAAAQDGDLVNDDPASSYDLMDTLQAEHIVLTRNNNRLKNQIRQHLSAADVHADRIGFLETQSETLNLKLMRAEREIETLQAKLDSDLKKRDEATNNILQKMARDNQGKVKGLQSALQASNVQRQRDLTAIQYKHDQAVADHQARVAELQGTIQRQDNMLQQLRNFHAQRRFPQPRVQAPRQVQVQGQRQVQVAQRQQTQHQQTQQQLAAQHQLAKRQQGQRWEIRRQLLEEIERQDEDLFPEAGAQNQEAEAQKQEAEAQKQEAEAQDQEVEAENQEVEAQNQEDTPQEDAPQEDTSQDEASQEDTPQEAT